MARPLDEEKLVAAANAQFERSLVRVRGALVGSVAALEHPGKGGVANYGEVFLRDNVPVMLYLLVQGRFAIVRNFLTVCLELQSTTYQTRGIFPTSFVEENGELVADYGQRCVGCTYSAVRTLILASATGCSGACSCYSTCCCTQASRGPRCCSYRIAAS